MSSSTSPLTSSSSSTPVYFTGMSNYAASLNNAINQEVELASLPIQLLQNNVSALTDQANEAQTIAGDFANVQSAVESLTAAASNLLTATVSGNAVATATLGSGATAGSYTLTVSNLGSYSDALSNDGLTTVTDPSSQTIDASSAYTLVVNGVQTAISYAGGNLNGLAQAINVAGAGVEATVVNVGSSSAPDYRLSLQSDQLGPVSMQLNDAANDGGTDLLSSSGTGVPAQYTVNGKQINSSSDTVTLAPGLTLQLTGTSSSAVTVTVAPDATSVGNGLESFVSAYNATMTELGKNRGQGGGALAGESIVYDLTNDLQSLANYTSGSGTIVSLSDLGVTFNDTTGQLSFDQSTFDAATSGQSDALTAFMGSATGGGFLQAATNTMTSALDPTSGELPQEYNSLVSTIQSTNSQITDKQTQVNQLQASLTQQMSAADAVIYSLQQQATEMQDLFQSIQANEMGTANS
ncbi:MAG TPA: flagellar filament capping protein FliD [Bryobacteraceae bacterium]|nr:flagellar filament capping protein FliD [Bryobacteraceae bacterium]